MSTFSQQHKYGSHKYELWFSQTPESPKQICRTVSYRNITHPSVNLRYMGRESMLEDFVSGILIQLLLEATRGLRQTQLWWSGQGSQTDTALVKWAAVTRLLRGGGCHSNCAQGMHSLFVLWFNEATRQGRPEWVRTGSKKRRPDMAQITSFQEGNGPTILVVTAIFMGQVPFKTLFSGPNWPRPLRVRPLQPAFLSSQSPC